MITVTPVTGVEIAPFVISYKMPDTSSLQDLIQHSEAINAWGDSTVGQNLIKLEVRKSTQINLPQLGFNQQQINDLAPLCRVLSFRLFIKLPRGKHGVS